MATALPIHPTSTKQTIWGPYPYPKEEEAEEAEEENIQVLLKTPGGKTASFSVPACLFQANNYDALLYRLIRAAGVRDADANVTTRKISDGTSGSLGQVMLLHNGRPLDPSSLPDISTTTTSTTYLELKCRLLGGMDRQNRVGSKFGGGGVSSAQQSERERKERLKRLALESIDLAKDPYLMRNHLGTYECKLCLTLHTNEANYLSHTQGKKHQQGLAKRAYMEKLKQEKEQAQAQASGMPMITHQPKPKKIRIGRPAYQVFKSRDADTNQRCLSFELHFPEIEQDLQPRHRFMSAFEQRVESPPDRRFQYLLFAADPYETVAFKIPNEPIDKSAEKFVTHWEPDSKKFTLTLYFLEGEEAAAAEQAQAQQQPQYHAAGGTFGANPLQMAR